MKKYGVSSKRAAVLAQAIMWLDRSDAELSGPEFRLWLSHSQVHVEVALEAACLMFRLRCLSEADWNRIEQEAQSLPDYLRLEIDREST